MSSSESKISKDSTKTAKDVNVTLFDVANENFTKVVNQTAKVQPEYAQAISNLQQEYIELLQLKSHIVF